MTAPSALLVWESIVPTVVTPDPPVAQAAKASWVALPEVCKHCPELTGAAVGRVKEYDAAWLLEATRVVV
jgi:hypothetical protein